MAKLYNRAAHTTSTTGTGTITLGSAIAGGSTINASGWQSFATAGVSNGETVPYLILDANNAWEYGTGTYTSAGTTLSRTLGQSSTGSLLNLSGSAQVFIPARKEDIANLLENNTFTATNTFSGTVIVTGPFGLGDTDDSHSLIIAPGSNLTANRTFTLTTGDADRTLTLGGNATLNGGTVTSGTHSGTNTGDQTLASLSGAKLADQQAFTGSGTWTKPSGFSAEAYVLIEGWGGGGGAGRSSIANATGGGGGGAYKFRWILLSAMGATETITVGAAGAGRTGSAGTGTAGGNTTVGALLTAYGGGAGSGGAALGNAGSGLGGDQYATGSSNINVPAGTGLNGDFFTGGIGGGNDDGSLITLATNAVNGGGGGGGGRAGTTTAGTSQFGGAGGAGAASPSNGTQPGGGGGGSTSANVNGANGGAGKVIITTFDGA